MKTRLTFAVLALLVAAPPCFAQPALERLEEMIRQEGEAAAGEAVQPPDADPAAQPGPQEPLGAEPPQEAYLGVMVDDREDRGRGVRILQVFRGGPADQAGLRPDDLITGLGGVRVRSMEDMAAIVGGLRPGGTLGFDVLRDQQQQEIPVTLGRRPPAVAPTEQPEPEEPPGDNEPKMAELLQRIEDLERRVMRLERALQQQ